MNSSYFSCLFFWHHGSPLHPRYKRCSTGQSLLKNILIFFYPSHFTSFVRIFCSALSYQLLSFLSNFSIVTSWRHHIFSFRHRRGTLDRRSRHASRGWSRLRHRRGMLDRSRLCHRRGTLDRRSCSASRGHDEFGRRRGTLDRSRLHHFSIMN